MTRPRVRRRRDAPAVVLACIVPLLPAARREWGRAMTAELAALDPAMDRWRFTADCALAVMRRPALGALASLTSVVGIVVTTVLLTARTAYLPLHIALVAMVSVLGVLHLVGDRALSASARTSGSRAAAAVRVVGASALAWLTLGIVLSDRSGGGDVVDRASTGVPVFTVLIGLYLVGFMSLTSLAVVDARLVTRGAGLGFAAAVLWLVSVLARPPLPLSSASAFVVLGVAILVAAAVGASRGAAVRTALCTTLIGALSIFALVELALTYGPAIWVPSDTAALTPAARLAQSRVEAGEGYLLVLLLGVPAAIALLADAVRLHRAARRSGAQAW